MPRTWTSRAVHLAQTLHKINDLKLENNLKRKIRKTYLSTFFLKRYDSQNKLANIAGYNVRFCTYRSLSYLFNEIFLDQEYCFVSNKTRPFIVDCGSNIGMSVIYFKMIYPNSEVLAFEPDEEAFACLEENMKANEIHAVCLNRKAISNKEGDMDFYYDQDNPGSLGMSTFRERMPKNKKVVESVLLSKYIDREVDFLKLDIEGAERDVVEDLSNEGKLSYIKQILIEYHHHIVKDIDALSHMLRYLEDAGFGYEIQSGVERPFKRQQFQDILIYAYQKESLNESDLAA